MWVTGGKGQSKSGKKVWGQTSWYLTLKERVAKERMNKGHTTRLYRHVMVYFY